ncbi:MAG: enoyl-CoA hydratase/isomerase family protein [Candidatus Hydrogenedentes bacterium]|nr:enoyl-CoA hydratase/isomerase family protein [Candidatus Hydrogenedentota bacterium]
MAYQFILTDKAGGCGTITLNRPKANALSLELVTEIGSAVQNFIEDAEVRCILITGGEGKFFSGGADIPSLGSSLGAPFAEGQPLPAGLKTMDIIENSPKPVIAAVNGIAVGGGCELTLACHFRLAADTAVFGQPEINLGIVPGWGGCHRLPRLIGEARALDWMLTGRMINAQEALASGLVLKVVPLPELANAARELAGALAGKPAVATRAILRAVRERALQPDRGKALEAEAFAEAAASRDAAEGVAAFIEKRPPNFTGA